ncbi:TPA: ead/Ea22-like family protein [Serratia marcescens]
MDKFSELKAAAMAATQGPWNAFISGNTCAVHSPGDKRCEDIINWPGFDCRQNAANNAAFIAAANPAAVLELLAELEAKDKRIADLEAKLTRAEKHIADDEEYIEKLESAWKRINELEINEKQMLRDHYCAEDALVRRRNELESALDGMYEAVTGRRPAWGCGFWEDEAVKEVAQIHAELEARLTTPMRLPAAKDTSQGWTIDPDYLSAIAEKVGHSEDEGSPSMETVEAVLLATGFTVGDETASVAPAEGQLVTAMGYQGGRNS